ncbi:FG-GAP-like repeat-containing protein [Nannocystis bainbridge]|uniref:FG-GAP-like repeat-containing protein n=1 Tax=Nannocystis bainbridge TaxID=2995303 RepID=A0ABT5E1T7_9BACT|nr:FG-GAP-like repeat-containing protein [Nannocystis bainbridge]MDC0718938.1 FG-GAP-like repeat-containing protein [Nannocystis bainbridge]
MRQPSRGLRFLVFALATSSADIAAAAGPPLHEPFRVMTYNVRKITDEDPGDYAWSERSPGVMALIEGNGPDVFGVQEASDPVIQGDLVAAFDATHDRFHPPNGSPKIIFFRRGRFERLIDPPEDGQGNIGIPNPYAEDHACHPNASGRTAAWVKLRDLVSGRGYLIVNAHVAHGAGCWLARNAAAEALHALVAAQGQGLTVVLIGDLNSDPQRQGAGDDDDIVPLLEAPQAGYALARSARYSGTTSEDTATFNSSWKAPSSSYTRLDYVFTSVEDATAYHPSIDRSEYGGISPSDHFAVLATIRTAPFAPAPRSDDRGDGEGARLYFADVNGDGAADKIGWDPAQGGVRVHLNDGAANFGAAIAGASATAETTLSFADVDGDGCADRIDWSPAVEAGRTRIARSQCDGTFAAAATSNDGSAQAGTRLTFARLDADACADRIAWDPGGDGQTRAALSRCDGQFADEVLGDDAGISQNPDAQLGFADLTGDWLADKIVWDPEANEGRTRVFAGDGDGTFTFHSEHAAGTSGVAASRFFYGDVDGDGHADKLFWRASFREGRPQLYYGHADGFDPHPTMVNAGPSESSANRFLLADVDGSGSVDLIAWDPSVDGATRAYLALVHAPESEQPEPTTGGEEGTTSTSGEESGTSTTSSGEAPTSSGEETTGGGAGEASSGPASASDGGTPADGAEEGCGCVGDPRGDGRGALVMLVAALGLRRRRRTQRSGGASASGR